MDFSKEIEFARKHKGDDPIKLLLKQSKYPEIDIKFVAQQLEGQRQASAKWPRLSRCENFAYPPKLNREQSSSEQTANYKVQAILKDFPSDETISIADLTGGMGIDSIAFASQEDYITQVEYCEMDPILVKLMEYNTNILQLANIHCHQGDAIEWLRKDDRHFNIIYIDPARRDRQGNKTKAFEDCTPNILDVLPLLEEHCDYLVIKASPMIDISIAAKQLRNVNDIYIISVKGECKEVLFVCSNKKQEYAYHCVNCLLSDKQEFDFTIKEEERANIPICQTVAKYLYEPNASIMKGGCYKLIGERYTLTVLGKNTHLYTSDTLIENFPGRIFEIIQDVALNKKAVLKLIPEKKAHVISRNFPIEAAKLQQQIGLTEGGNLFIIATTVGSTKSGFLCRLVR